ncbi:MAG: VOC family protein [Phycisphaerales bacterium]|nr:VOC family protein [Phycisphaerales bacterium]
MTRLGQLHHVEVNVSNLERATAFWSWLLTHLGYTRYQQWATGISYRRDDTYLVFVQTQPAHRTPQYHRARTGLNHLAFHADTPAQVDELTAQLVVRGVTILYPDRHPHAGGPDTYAVFFEDPDRIKVEFVAPAPNAPTTGSKPA